MRSAPGHKRQLVRDLVSLIRIDSVSALSSLPVARRVAGLLRRAGFRVFWQREKRGGVNHANVIGIKGYGNNSLLLCSHMDTVPAGDPAKWTRTGGDPWDPRVLGGRVTGLGAADDKGPLVSMIYAGAAWRAEDLKRPLIVMGTYGEEHGMGGARLFVKRWRGPKPAAAFVGEPTALSVTYRHKGMGVLVVTLTTRLKMPAGGTRRVFRGRQGHSSRPWTGDNALDKAARFLRRQARRAGAAIASLDGGFAANLIPDRAEAALSGGRGASRPAFPCEAVAGTFEAVQTLVKRRARAKDRSLYPPVVTSNFGIARTHGARLSMTFDFRLLPGQDIRSFKRELERSLKPLLTARGGVSFSVRAERDNPPLGLTAGHKLVLAARGALRKSGLNVRLETKPSCTEAGIYARWGVPAVIFGPGRAAGNIHAPNESVEVSQLERGVRSFDALIRAHCARGRK